MNVCTRLLLERRLINWPCPLQLLLLPQFADDQVWRVFEEYRTNYHPPMVATKGTYIHVFKEYKHSLSKKQLNQLLILIDPWHPPQGTNGSHRNTMCDRATKFTKMKTKLKKRKSVLGIRDLEAEPPVDLNAQVKRGRGMGSGRATTTTSLASAPNSPTKERPSQKHCHQPSPGRKQMDALRLDMSKMGADLADLKSKIKAQNKKGTAIEQEADKNNKLRLSSHRKIASGKSQRTPRAFFC